jgi:hypothetical protein
MRRYRIDTEDNLRARKFVTQARVLRRTVNIVVGILTVGAVLQTFESVQRYGVSLFASAGAAGLILGLAARPVLANLIAGIQIALTQPIRIDDVVIVEGEWGWIEEIFATYVVVRLWDLRRMIVPLSHFIEQPFQNWTRESASIIGAVYWHLDYTVPVAKVRAKLAEIVEASPHWDGKVVNLQVTDTDKDTVTVRGLMSARTSPQAWGPALRGAREADDLAAGASPPRRCRACAARCGCSAATPRPRHGRRRHRDAGTTGRSRSWAAPMCTSTTISGCWRRRDGASATSTTATRCGVGTSATGSRPRPSATLRRCPQRACGARSSAARRHITRPTSSPRSPPASRCSRRSRSRAAQGRRSAAPTWPRPRGFPSTPTILCGQTPASRVSARGSRRVPLGKIVHARMRFSHDGGYADWLDLDAWMTDPALACYGGFADEAVHALDMLQWLAGPIADGATRTGNALDHRVDDHGAAVLSFETGATGVAEAGWTDTAMRLELDIIGSQAAIRLAEGRADLRPRGTDAPSDSVPPRAARRGRGPPAFPRRAPSGETAQGLVQPHEGAAVNALLDAMGLRLGDDAS